MSKDCLTHFCSLSLTILIVVKHAMATGQGSANLCVLLRSKGNVTKSLHFTITPSQRLKQCILTINYNYLLDFHICIFIISIV